MTEPVYGYRHLANDGYRGCRSHRLDVVLSDSETQDGKRIWICTTCGHRGAWTDGWATFGTMCCTEAVACPTCAKKQRTREAD